MGLTRPPNSSNMAQVDLFTDQDTVKCIQITRSCESLDCQFKHSWESIANLCNPRCDKLNVCKSFCVPETSPSLSNTQVQIEDSIYFLLVVRLSVSIPPRFTNDTCHASVGRQQLINYIWKNAKDTCRGPLQNWPMNLVHLQRIIKMMIKDQSLQQIWRTNLYSQF